MAADETKKDAAKAAGEAEGKAKAPARKAPAKKAAAKAPAKKPATRKAAKPATTETVEAKADAKKLAARKPAAKKPAAGKATPAKSRPASKAADKTSSKKSRTEAKKEQPKVLVRASARYVRVAPRKARLIADQVRGMHIEKALALLQFSPRSAAQDIQKLINSAASNAENNHDLIADEMRVAEITVDEGPTLKRFRPRALGRATPIHKRTSHISVALSPEE